MKFKAEKEKKKLPLVFLVSYFDPSPERAGIFDCEALTKNTGVLFWNPRCLDSRYISHFLLGNPLGCLPFFAFCHRNAVLLILITLLLSLHFRISDSRRRSSGILEERQTVTGVYSWNSCLTSHEIRNVFS